MPHQINLAISFGLASSFILFCRILYHQYWSKHTEIAKEKENNPSINTGLLRISSSNVTVDMSPFFLQQYVQSHAGAIFEPYLRLITEMALNLAYQVRKQHVEFGPDVCTLLGRSWRQLLSEYMLFAGVPSLVRRRARKLLLYITGSKVSCVIPCGKVLLVAVYMCVKISVLANICYTLAFFLIGERAVPRYSMTNDLQLHDLATLYCVRIATDWFCF